MTSQRATRRDFLRQGVRATCVVLVTDVFVAGASEAAAREKRAARTAEAAGELVLKPESTLGQVRTLERAAVLPEGQWYETEKRGSGFLFRLPVGSLLQARYLTADLLLDGDTTASFTLVFQEGPHGPATHVVFSLLNQCQARVVVPLTVLDLNRWYFGRRGAWLKPRCGGARVDPARVDRVLLKVSRKAEGPVRWCQTPFRLTTRPVAPPKKLVLPKGPLLDRFGQSRIRDWPGKTRSERDLVERLRAQWQRVDQQRWPAHFSRWGGWKQKRLTGPTGFFRTHHDGRRWWLVDPDGYAFWSAGMDCVRPEVTANVEQLTEALEWVPEPNGPFAPAVGIRGGRVVQVEYLIANLIRAFGPDDWYDRWKKLALAFLRKAGFNTVGNWSHFSVAQEARFPYVRPLSFRAKRVRTVYRDFPDVFHPDFVRDAADYAAQLADTRDDPALVGYFMMNEPKWAFSSELPAVGMLYTTAECETRRELARFLGQRYSDSRSLSEAWGREVDFERVARGRWTGRPNKKALADLTEFSQRMVTRYFHVLAEACRRVDPNHLNLGIRCAGRAHDWTLEGMKAFDVFSMNSYRPKIPAARLAEICKKLNRPALIGEYHFGALDVGLPSSGLVRVASQADRGKAYRVYLEFAAAQPECVGAHWFTLYDQSALGRFDGENYNIGFLDICHRPYEPLLAAARAAHEALYAVADGRQEPFSDQPKYLPPVT